MSWFSSHRTKALFCQLRATGTTQWTSCRVGPAAATPPRRRGHLSLTYGLTKALAERPPRDWPKLTGEVISLLAKQANLVSDTGQKVWALPPLGGGGASRCAFLHMSIGSSQYRLQTGAPRSKAVRPMPQALQGSKGWQSLQLVGGQVQPTPRPTRLPGPSSEPSGSPPLGPLAFGTTASPPLSSSPKR